MEQQQFIIQCLLSSEKIFNLTQSIVSADYFDNINKKIIQYIKEYSNEYRSLPLFELLNTKFSTKLSKIPIDTKDEKPVLDNIEIYCRKRAMTNAIHKAAEILAKESKEEANHGEIENLVKEALLISIKSDLGTDLFKDPSHTLSLIQSKNNMVSTGIHALDKMVSGFGDGKGGLGRGELTVFAGNSGAGKSLILQNVCLYVAERGMNVLYVTLELSEALTAARMYTMITGKNKSTMLGDLSNTGLEIIMKSKSAGKLTVKYMNSGSSSNDLRAYLTEYQIQNNHVPDMVAVDYLDLMYPNNKSINPSDLFIKDKFVSEELRNLGVDFNTSMVSASQMNRCLTLDTKIIANGKEIDIVNVKVGDLLTSNGFPVQVAKVYPITKQKVYKITTKSGRVIKCSERHLFPTTNGLTSIEGISGIRLQKGSILFIDK